MENDQDPLITFYRILPNGLKPRRALNDAAGTLPVRAYRYCEPARMASSFGYYAFLPMSFQIEWDGGQGGIWSYDEGVTWYPLTEAAYPGSMSLWDSVAPDYCRGWCPPFLTFLEDQGMIQVWTGWMVRTAPDWSLLVRGTANLPRIAGVEILEGIIETDVWFGPLFMNIKLHKSDTPIFFDHMRPILQVQPIHRASYADQTLDRISVIDTPEMMPEELWRAYDSTLVEHIIRNPERGHYAKLARRRRAAEQKNGSASCPMAGHRVA